MKYRHYRTERSLSFGVYPAVSLAGAHTKRDEAKQLMAEGVDPAAQKKLERIAAETVARNTFGLVAEEFLSNLEANGRNLDESKQTAFIAAYENLLDSPAPDEAVLFVDAVHPTHATRPVGCWTTKQENLAIEQTSGRQRLNIHGAIDLETGQTSGRRVPVDREHEVEALYRERYSGFRCRG